jgi:hypothetical protein
LPEETNTSDKDDLEGLTWELYKSSAITLSYSVFKRKKGRHWWLTTVILADLKTKIGKITV